MGASEMPTTVTQAELQLAETRQKLAALTREYNHNGTVKDFSSEAERTEFSRIQQQFNRPRQAHRLTPVIEMKNESAAEYLRRNIECLTPYAQTRDGKARLDPSVLRGGPAWLALHADRVINEAMEAAHRADDLRPIIERDHTGREITSFVGSKSAWMNEFKQKTIDVGTIMVDGVPGSF
jgi:hypothetical protein